MTGWDEHGFAVMTGLPIDRYLGQGDLQDAENCNYAPVSVLAELGVDTSHGDPQVQFRDGRIFLLDGTVLERGGTLHCVWAVTVLPAYTEADVEAFAALLHDARDRGIWHGNYTLARWVLDHWSAPRERAAYERGKAEMIPALQLAYERGLREAAEGPPYTDADERRVGDALEEYYRRMGAPPSMTRPYAAARMALAAATAGGRRLAGPWKPAEQPVPVGVVLLAAVLELPRLGSDVASLIGIETGKRYVRCGNCWRPEGGDKVLQLGELLDAEGPVRIEYDAEPAHGGTVATQPAVHAEAPVDSDFDLRRLGLMRTPVVPLLPEPLLYEPVTQAEDDAHMRVMEERMEHEAEQGEGDDRG